MHFDNPNLVPDKMPTILIGGGGVKMGLTKLKIGTDQDFIVPILVYII